jgi:large subunit ribosomal protein L29
MKDTSLTEMPINELNDLLISEKDRLDKLRMSHAVSPLENPLSIKYSRKKIARIMTQLSLRKKTEK